MPTDTGLGFVLVQHLDPQHESALTQLLTRATSMPVREVTNNLRVEPDHVYVIPPNTNLSISQGVLKLQPRQPTRTPARSIDAFLESLAESHRQRAIGVILSGTATDGTLGLEAIKAEGGITFAQDESAKYDSMPRSAIGAGCVDFVLKPEDIAKELARIAKHPYVAGGQNVFTEDQTDAYRSKQREQREVKPSLPPFSSVQALGETAKAENGFKKILVLLRNHSGVDFSLYKSTTIQRRINRRMVLHKQDTTEDYAGFLRGNSKELDALYSDVLISVTSFFRNPEAFDILKRTVFPKLLQKRGDDPVRVWVLGCATGQEAYSIAMAFAESAEHAQRSRNLQVFATDLNEALLDKARQGLYAKSLAQDISPERLRRFFVEEQGGYRVIKPLREMVVFARQNLISDPPFSRLDLISCRNLLIYLDAGLQKKAIPTFHYALKPQGFLFLGASESISGFTDLFEPADKKHKIYSKKTAPAVALHLPVKKERGEGVLQKETKGTKGSLPSLSSVKNLAGQPEGFRGELSAQREADRVTVNQFAPPGVLISADLQILQFRGPTGAYLQPPPTGKATFDVLKMAREGLMLPLRAAINKAKKENKTVRRENVQVQQNGNTRMVNVEVIPLKNLRERCYLILFEESEKRVLQKETKKSGKKEVSSLSSLPSVKTSSTAIRRNAQLERELAETRDYLQSLQEQYEAANEELQASNEEVQSANEELQSINEELETSKEELESSNEELTTVNEEMASRNTELSRLNADLRNLQSATKLPIMLLGRDLTIRRFSEPAEKIFNLLATDVGRSLANIRHNLVLSAVGRTPDAPGSKVSRGGAHGVTRPTASAATTFALEDFVREVIDTVREQEREVQDKDGRWYSLRGRPYMTVDNKIDGAVLVLLDIDTLKRTEEQLRLARDYAEATIRTTRDPLVILRANLRVEKASEAFYKTFQVSAPETEGKLIYALGGGQWNIPKLRQLLEEIIPRNSFFNDLEVTHDFPRIGRRIMLLNARRLDDSSGMPERILLGIEDITQRMRLDESVRQSEDRFRSLVLASAQVVWTADAEGLVEQDSPTWRAFTGQTLEERKGWGWLDAVHPDDREPTRKLWSECVARKRVYDTQYRLRKPDGVYRWTAVRAVPVLNADGGIREWIGTNTDITQRKMAEDALRQSEERYRTLFDLGPVAVYSIDPSGVIQNFNRRATELWGRKPALGDTDERFCGSFKLFRSDGSFMPHEQCPMAEVVSGKIAAANDQEVIIERPDGSRVTVIVNIRPLKNERGEVIGAINCFYDITERKQAEEARAKLASLVESSDDAIVGMEINGIITSWNKGAQRLFGYTTQEVIGQPVTMLIPPERFDEEPSILERICRGETIQHYETVRRRKDGRLLDLSLTVSPIMNSAGEVVGASKIARDITHRKKADKALRESQSLLADRATQLEQLVAERTARLQDTIGELEHFSYTITHDMRAPLRTMQGFAGLLLSQPGEQFTAESADYLRRIINAAGRMDALIRDSLQYAKVVREHIPLAPVDPAHILHGILESYPTLQPPNVKIQVVEPLPAVIANETGLAQCFSNLLANAIKFVKRGVVPKVRVWAEERGTSERRSVENSATLQRFDAPHSDAPTVRFWFEDNGIGIPKEYQERIFHMFQQLDRSFEGTGVGLALVRKTAERMGGKVGVESEPGKGSRFWLEFKKTEPAKADSPAVTNPLIH